MTKSLSGNKKTVLMTLISLSIPTIIEEVMSTLIQYVDTAMVGRLGEKATAAVSTTTTINWLMFSIPSAIGVALLAIAAKAMGSKNEELLKKVAGQSILLAFVVGIILECMALLLSPFIPVWMSAAPEIQEEASRYFTILSTTLVLRTSSRIFASMMRATKDTRTPMIISFAENILNVILNYFFIYYLSLGCTGAAIASAISYGIGGLAMFIVFRRNTYLRCSYRLILPDKDILKQTFEIGLPALLTNIAACMGYVVFAALVSGMGTRVFAAHSIAVAAEQIVYIPGYGLRTATSALVGNALGEGDYKKLKYTEDLSILITMGIMVLNGSLLFVFARPFMSLFTTSEGVVALGSQMLKMVAFSEPFFGLMIVVEGIFYGMGRTKNVFTIETFSMWCVRIVSTFLCVRVFHLSLTAVWICMIADNVVKAVLLEISMLSDRQKRERN